MAEMVEVVIESLRVSLTNQQRIVVLRELEVERYLPIWIGPYEAESITIALQEIEIARPQTHDLLKNLLHALNARLMRVEIISLRDDVFYGNLVLEVNGNILNVDSRPSDAMALAVRAHVPILVARDVMEKAGIVPEENLDEETPQPEDRPIKEGEEQIEGEERLSVFEDFLQNLDLNEDKPDSEAGDSETDEDETEK